MVEISLQTAADEAAIEILMDSAFGAARHSRSVWTLRLLPPVAELSLVPVSYTHLTLPTILLV